MATNKLAILTPRQREIYDFLKDKILNRGYGPTVREIGAEFGIRSPNGVMCHLKALEKKGLITRESHLSRAIQLADKPQQKTSVLLAGSLKSGGKFVAADAGEQIDFGDVLGSGDRFCVRVGDESLSEDRISRGDHVIGAKQASYRNGDVIVAVIKGKGTVKRYYREANRVRLESIYSSTDPTYAAEEDVLGIVVGIIRRC